MAPFMYPPAATGPGPESISRSYWELSARDSPELTPTSALPRCCHGSMCPAMSTGSLQVSSKVWARYAAEALEPGDGCPIYLWGERVLLFYR